MRAVPAAPGMTFASGTVHAAIFSPFGHILQYPFGLLCTKNVVAKQKPSPIFEVVQQIGRSYRKYVVTFPAPKGAVCASLPRRGKAERSFRPQALWPVPSVHSRLVNLACRARGLCVQRPARCPRLPLMRCTIPCSTRQAFLAHSLKRSTPLTVHPFPPLPTPAGPAASAPPGPHGRAPACPPSTPPAWPTAPPALRTPTVPWPCRARACRRHRQSPYRHSLP